MKRLLAVTGMIFFAVCFTNAAQAVPMSGLVAYYDFEGDVTDSSVEGNDGSVNGSITYTSGISGQGAIIDGNVIVSSPSGFSTGGSARTISAWASMSSGNLSASDQQVAGYGALAPGQMFAIQYGLGNSYDYGAWLFGCGPDVECDTGSPGQIPLDTFVHVAITYDTGTVGVYVNGSLYQSATEVANTAASDFYIGGFGASDFVSFNGVIDEVGVWNRALTATEIQRLFDQPGIPVPEPDTALLLLLGLAGIALNRRQKVT